MHFQYLVVIFFQTTPKITPWLSCMGKIWCKFCLKSGPCYRDVWRMFDINAMMICLISFWLLQSLKVLRIVTFKHSHDRHEVQLLVEILTKIIVFSYGYCKIFSRTTTFNLFFDAEIVYTQLATGNYYHDLYVLFNYLKMYVTKSSWPWQRFIWGYSLTQYVVNTWWWEIDIHEYY